jgi:LysR family transcriptional regulator, glycine cleavage system transcriptional activator
MPRRLPPLNAIKSFEASARNESFTKAAIELCVTQGAVSQQVKLLEDHLGFKLFVREHQKLALTEQAVVYYACVRDVLDRLAMATENLMARATSGILTVSASPDFAAKWLVHRVGEFAVVCPDIDLRVSASLHHVDFAREDIDVAVRHGDGKWPGLHCVRVTSERLFAVCSPKLLQGKNGIRDVQDLIRYPLIHLDDRQAWAEWLAKAGVSISNLQHGPVFNRASMVIDAAIDGQGIALARTTLASWDVVSGRLRVMPGFSAPLRKTYWIVCPSAAANLPKVARFREWIVTEANKDTACVTASLH